MNKIAARFALDRLHDIDREIDSSFGRQLADAISDRRGNVEFERNLRESLYATKRGIMLKLFDLE